MIWPSSQWKPGARRPCTGGSAVSISPDKDTVDAERQPVALFAPTNRAPIDGPPGLVAVLSREMMWSAALPGLFRVLQTVPAGSEFSMHCAATTIALKRTHAVQAVLEHPALAWLCFIDDDMVPPPDVVAR